MARGRRIAGIGASAWMTLGLMSSACYVTPDTLGNPCVIDEDCAGDQVCGDEGVCVGPLDDTGSGETGAEGMISEGEETGSSDDGETTGAAAEGQVRFIHASPDAGAVDVYAGEDGELLATNLSYGDASEWFALEVGTAAFQVRPTGADSMSPAVLMTETIDLDEGDRFSTVIAGSVDGGEEDGLRALSVLEQWGNDRADRARVRLVHASSDAPDFTIDGLEGLPFPLERFGDSSAPGVPIDVAGGTRLEFLEGDDTVTTFTAPPLSEGDQVLVVATGLVDSLARSPDGFGLIVVGEDGLLGRVLQDPQVFTLHGARDAGNLENCTDGFEVAANFNYGEVQSAFLSPGEYNFEIFGYPSGCTGLALNPGGNASGDLEAGERYLLLLTGEQTPVQGEPSIQVAPFVDRFPASDEGGTAIRFVHGASAEQIYVGNVTDGEVKAEDVYTNPIAWRSESNEVPLPEAPYLLGVADAVGKPSPPLTPLVTFDYVASPGARQWGIVSGDPSPDGEDDGIIQLMLIDTATENWDVELVDINL